MATIKWRYNKLPHQKEFHEDLTSNILCMVSGLGAGKSYALMMKLLWLSWLNRDHAGGLLCPTVMDFKRDMLPLFQECFDNHGLSKYCKYNKQDAAFKFPWNKAPLYVFSGERAIAGPNLAYCGINEPSLIKYERINEMMRRVRVADAPYSQKCMTGTPEDAHGWFQDFIESHQKTGRLKLVTASTSDNYHLDPDYYQHLKETLDPIQFRVFAEGELIFMNSNMFYYSYSKENYTDREIDPLYPLYVNIDFNVGNMTATVCQQEIVDGKKISYFVDEIVIKNTAADTYQMAEEIKKRYQDYLDNMIITCDASGKARKTTGPSDVNVLKEYFGEDAVRYRAKGNIRLRKRQILVNGCLANRKILINPEKCPTLDKDLRKVTQVEDYTKDKKNPDLTHSSDTLDYYVDFEYELLERKTFSHHQAR